MVVGLEFQKIETFCKFDQKIKSSLFHLFYFFFQCWSENQKCRQLLELLIKAVKQWKKRTFALLFKVAKNSFDFLIYLLEFDTFWPPLFYKALLKNCYLFFHNLSIFQYYFPSIKVLNCKTKLWTFLRMSGLVLFQ